MFAYLNNFFEKGSVQYLLSDEKSLRKIGFLGYLIGIFSLFVSLRLAQAAAGSFFSFFFFFSIIIMINYGESAITGLFLDMLGHRGSPSSLFYMFGFGQFIWLAAIPSFFISKVSGFPFYIFAYILFLTVFFLRLKFIKEIYNVRYKMALISFTAPYIITYMLSIFAVLYSFYWIAALID
ncbi:MAG: hypothetical protein GX447_05650 [Elusimicrobia bacterium]|nr:hypothetical protein [Elusimicrobiota bacterium]